jgi:hypothetical protein
MRADTHTMRTEDTPRDFLRNSEFNPKRAETEFPNARRLTFGGLFVSHSGVDTVPIRERIIFPVVFVTNSWSRSLGSCEERVGTSGSGVGP